MSETTQKLGVDQHPQRGVKVIKKHAVSAQCCEMRIPFERTEYHFLYISELLRNAFSPGDCMKCGTLTFYDWNK